MPFQKRVRYFDDADGFDGMDGSVPNMENRITLQDEKCVDACVPLKHDARAHPCSPLISNVMNMAREVFHTLGKGYSESVYKNALLVLLKKQGLFCTSELVIPIIFQVYFFFDNPSFFSELTHGLS